MVMTSGLCHKINDFHPDVFLSVKPNRETVLALVRMVTTRQRLGLNCGGRIELGGESTVQNTGHSAAGSE